MPDDEREAWVDAQAQNLIDAFDRDQKTIFRGPTMSKEEAKKFLDGEFMTEEQFRAAYPNAVLVPPPPTEDVYEYNVDLVINDEVVKVFNEEWDLATAQHDFINRVRRSLQKVVDFWNEPSAPDNGVNIVYGEGEDHTIIGTGKIFADEKGVQMIATLNPLGKGLISTHDINAFSIYTPNEEEVTDAQTI